MRCGAVCSQSLDFYGISRCRDTAGAERYESMSRIYYRGAKAALICYDMTDEESFSKVKFWLSELTENEPECALYVVGTKGKLVLHLRTKSKRKKKKNES